MGITVSDKRLYWLGLAAGLFSVLNFSLLIVVGRLGVIGDTLTVFDQAALRHAAAALCALPILVRYWPWNLSLWRHVILAATGGAPYIFVLFSGMIFAPAAHAAIVMKGALPFMAALVGWLWLRQMPGRWQVIGIIVAAGGLLLVGWDALAFGISGQWRGHLLFIAAAGSVGIWYVAVRHWGLSIPQMFAATLVLNAVVYLPVWWLFLPCSVTTAPAADIALQAGILGVWGAFLGAYAQATAVRILGPTRLATIMAGGPALAAVIAIPVLAEYPSALTIAGIAVVAAGVLLTVLPGLREELARR